MSRQRQAQIAIANNVLKAFREENMPWRNDRGIPTNAVTGCKYSGINLLILDSVATARNYRSKWWATYHQWRAIGMQIGKRRPKYTEWGVSTVSWKKFVKAVDKGNIISIERYGLMQQHSVFNAEQVFGPNLNKYLITLNEYATVDYSGIESLIEATGAVVQHVDNLERGEYSRNDDVIRLPVRSFFLNERQYIATKVHELFHWVESRTEWVGSEDQAELAAEIGTGYLESEFGLPHDSDMKNCRKWLPTWISSIEKDPRYLFDAAAQAAHGLEYLLSFGLQPEN